jgi:choline kinase
MKAIILAAGVGRRLKPLTDSTPKALIRIGTSSVLERMLDSLIAAGTKDICLVVGHLKDKIKLVVGQNYKGVAIRYIPNPDYERGSILSVWAARNCFDDDILLMDSDVIFEDVLLEKLIKSKNENCFLMDKNNTESGEEMKIAALNKRVVEIARRITQKHDEAGEGIGFLKLSVKYRKEFLDIFKSAVARDKDCDYENALDGLVGRIPVGFEDVTGLKWTEIDFEADIEKAKALNI